MDIFWQITVVETLLNVAVFAVAVIAFGFVRLGLARRRLHVPQLSNAAVGLLFGAATAAVQLMPIHLPGGAPTGSQTLLLALAGMIAGPVAAVVGAAVAIAAQCLAALNSGAFDGFGLTALVVATVVGVGLRLAVRRFAPKTPISYYHCPILGILCAAFDLAALWVFQGRPAMIESAPAAVVAGLVVATVLGTLLLHETRRHEAEQELRDSQTRLAAQARELELARDAAEYASHSKSAFLANMSHELRTPLNAILGFSELLAEETFGPIGVPRYKEYASDIHASGAHLLSLINDLLDVAKIEAGKMEIAPDVLDAPRVFAVALKLIAIKAHEKHQALAITVAPDAPQLYADERAIKQILLNLVSNAVKFTPEGGCIAVTGGPDGAGGFMIVCQDNGPGIPKDKLDKIFTSFSQVDNRYDRQAGGTGLGLSLVRGLAELHGGRAWMESDFGKGCRACVVLPPPPQHRKDAAAA